MLETICYDQLGVGNGVWDNEGNYDTGLLEVNVRLVVRCTLNKVWR